VYRLYRLEPICSSQSTTMWSCHFWPAPLLVCSFTTMISDLGVMHEIARHHLQVFLGYSSCGSLRFASVSRFSSPSPTPISPYAVSISKTSPASPVHPCNRSRFASPPNVSFTGALNRRAFSIYYHSHDGELHAIPTSGWIIRTQRSQCSALTSAVLVWGSGQQART